MNSQESFFQTHGEATTEEEELILLALTIRIVPNGGQWEVQVRTTTHLKDGVHKVKTTILGHCKTRAEAEVFALKSRDLQWAW